MDVWNSGTTPVPGTCHNWRPVAASNAVTVPVMPWANRRPAAYAGVDLGPSRCGAVAGFMVNGAGLAVRQTSAPVAASSAVMTSSPSCRVNM